MTICLSCSVEHDELSAPTGGEGTRPTYGELRMDLLDVALEGREVGSVMVEVDIVKEAVARACGNHLVKPIKTLVRVRTRSNGGQRLLDRERVDVLLVPRRGLLRRDAVDIRLVQREDGYKSCQPHSARETYHTHWPNPAAVGEWRAEK